MVNKKKLNLLKINYTQISINLPPNIKKNRKKNSNEIAKKKALAKLFSFSLISLSLVDLPTDKVTLDYNTMILSHI